MIDIQNVSMAFGKRSILEDVNLTFKPGTISAITGKSGAGKTTLLGIISGLLRPDTGKVLFKGQNILRWGDLKRSRYRNREIGFVFQFFNLLSDNTSYQNIIYPALISPMRGDFDLDKEVRDLASYLNIEEVLHNYPSTLSGGERQRVAVARAIINKPKIILADEPTGNLDDLSAKGILSLFKRLRDESDICLIIVTHDPRIVEFADFHYHLHNAHLVKMKGSTTGTKKTASRKPDTEKKKTAKYPAVKVRAGAR